MDIFVVIFLSLIVVSIGIIIFTLFSIAKRQDERQDYIKSKAMSYTFSVVIGLLIIEIGLDIFQSITEKGNNGNRRAGADHRRTGNGKNYYN